jgi:hypothetical protein
MTEAIADYVGKEYSNEMRLLVKNQEENEPKEAVMPDNKEAKSPFVIVNSPVAHARASAPFARIRESPAKTFNPVSHSLNTHKPKPKQIRA